jgi:hypothetical protein
MTKTVGCRHSRFLPGDHLLTEPAGAYHQARVNLEPDAGLAGTEAARVGPPSFLTIDKCASR